MKILLSVRNVINVLGFRGADHWIHDSDYNRAHQSRHDFLNAKDRMRKTEFNQTSDVERLFQTLSGRRWRTGNSYYLPAARERDYGKPRCAFDCSHQRATRIGLDRIEASTFSGMIADFLEQIVNYKERKGSSSSIRRVAEQLETDLLEGKIEVKRPTSEAYPEFLYRPDQAEEGLRMSHSSAMVSELAPLVSFCEVLLNRVTCSSLRNLNLTCIPVHRPKLPKPSRVWSEPVSTS